MVIWIVLDRHVVERIPERFRRVLLREIEPLVADEHVLAIGLAGSLARGDVWDGSDIDLDVIVQGEQPCIALLKFKEVEIDFVYFNESQCEWLPYDVVPIYDPHHVIEEVLESRNQKSLRLKMINNSMEQSRRDLVKAKTFLDGNRTYSCLSYVHLAAEEIASAFTLLMGEAPTTRRTISRLELAISKKEDRSFLEEYLTLYNMGDNLGRTNFFYNELKTAYEKIWNHLIEKGIGTVRISHESTFQSFFRNRIEPIYHHDKRDFIWFTFHEFPFILQYSFKLEDPLDGHAFHEVNLEKTLAFHWINSYRAILETIPFEKAPTIYQNAEHLLEELRNIQKRQLI